MFARGALGGGLTEYEAGEDSREDGLDLRYPLDLLVWAEEGRGEFCGLGETDLADVETTFLTWVFAVTMAGRFLAENMSDI